MTKDETIAKIQDLIEQCEATAEECDSCMMCHYCCGYYTGDWTVPPRKEKDE